MSRGEEVFDACTVLPFGRMLKLYCLAVSQTGADFHELHHHEPNASNIFTFRGFGQAPFLQNAFSNVR